MPIDLSKIPDAEPKAKGVDLSGIPDAPLGPRMPVEEQEEKATFGKDLMNESWKLSQDIGSVYPLAETAASLISNWYGLPISGLAGLMALPANIFFDDAAKKTVESVQDWLIYDPQTVRGQARTESAFYPFHKLDQAGGAVGNKILAETNSPLLAAGAHALIAGAPAFLMGRSIPRAIVRDISRSSIVRSMTIKERGLIVQGLEETIRLNPEMTEAQIIKRWNGLKREALERRAVTKEPETVVDTKLNQIKKDAERGVVEAAVEKKMPVPRETLEVYKGEAFADEALARPNETVAPDIPTDEDIDMAFPADLEEVPFGEADTSFDFGANVGEDIRMVEEPISYDFKDVATGYMGVLISHVMAGEPGMRVPIEVGPGQGGGREFIGWKSTYPEWMLGKNWSKNQVVKALENAMEGKRLGTMQEAIVLTALEVAQEMFLDDIEKAIPENYELAEATIDKAIDDLLGKHERLKDIKKHLRAVRKALKQRPIKAKKKRIREITGQIKLSDMVREDVALKAAMKKAAAAARKAFSEGKKEALAKERMRLRLLRDVARANRDQRREISSMVKKLKKVKTAEMTPEQAQPINELLSGLDLVRRGKKKSVQLEATRKWMEENEDAEATDKMIDSVARLSKVNLNDITVDELRNIFNAVMHHVKLEKLKTKLRVGKQLRDQMKVLMQAVSEMNPIKEIVGDVVDVSALKGKNKGQIMKDLFGIRQDRHDLILESLGGNESVMYKVLFKDIKEGQMAQLKYKQDAFGKFKDAIEKTDLFGKGKKIENVDKWLNETVTTGRYTFTRNQRMAIYTHSLNPDNLASLVNGGFGVKAEGKTNEVHDISMEEVMAIVDSLTPEELAFSGPHVQALFEQQGKDLAKTFLEKNFYPLTIEPNYYPKEVMPIKLAMDFEKQEALEVFKGRTLRPGVFKGMTKKRIGSKKPIYLNGLTYDINRSVERTAAYVGLELPLSNASKMLYDRHGIFRSNIDKRYGASTFRNIEQGIRDIAGDWHSYSDLEKGAMTLKNKIAPAMLGLNPRVMAYQMLSYPMYWVYVRPEYLIKAMVEFIFDSKVLYDQHKLYSPEFVERISTGPSRDIADVAKAVSARRLFGGRESLSERTMGGIKLLDQVAVVPGMRAAVLQVLDEFEAGKLSRDVRIELEIKDEDIKDLSPIEKMQAAYKFADYVTERAQDMFSKEHQSPWQRGSGLEKLTSMFGSSTGMMLNLLRRTYREAKRRKDPEANNKLARAIISVMIINTLGVMGLKEIFNWFLGRKKKSSFVGRVFEEWSGLLFLFRDIASSAISKIEKGTWLGHDVGIPITRPIELLVNVIANGVQSIAGKTKAKREKALMKTVNDSISFLLMINGLPYETPKQLISAGAKRAVGGKP